MDWFRRRENEHRESAIQDAEDELRRATEQLEQTERRTDEINRIAEVIEDIGRRNHLGPSFFDAMGIQRKKA